MSSIPHMNIVAKDKLRNVWMTLGKTWNQASGYWTGRR